MTHLLPRAIEAFRRGFKACRPVERVVCQDFGMQQDDLLNQQIETGLYALEAEGMVVVPKAALDWLFGEAPDADGKWFGECAEATKLIAGRFKRTYWWRSKFRAMLQAAQEAMMLVSEEMLRAAVDAYHATDDFLVDKIRAALEAALAAMWQDISTAPKDGRRIIAYCDKIDPPIFQTQWHAWTGSWEGGGEWVDIWNNDPIETNDGPIWPSHWAQELPFPQPPRHKEGHTASVSGSEPDAAG